MMLLFGLANVWAAEVQEFVYTVSQNGKEIGQRSVVITHLPPSKSIPTAYKKVEMFSDFTLNVAGDSIRYQQKGVGQFSSTRSSFVISNQINEKTTEMQGKRDRRGNWTVFSINDGVVKKESYSSMDVYLTSMELFTPKIWEGGDRLDVLVVDGEDFLVQNSVWEEYSIQMETKELEDFVEQSNRAVLQQTSLSDVRDKDGVLLFAELQTLGTKISFSLKSIPSDRDYGEIKEENTFSGIEEQDL